MRFERVTETSGPRYVRDEKSPNICARTFTVIGLVRETHMV